MKRLLVIIIAVCFALCLSACAFSTRESKLPYTTDRAADGDTSYSALNISVAADVYQADGQDFARYTIGVSFLGGVLDEDDVLYAMDNVSKDIGVMLEYVYYDTMPRRYSYSEDYYDCYTFLAHNDYPYPLGYIDTEYGFFYARHKYTLVAPKWINEVRDSVYRRVKSSFLGAKSGYNSANKRRAEIDPESVRLRYYLIGDKLEAEGATAVRYDNLYNSIMWEATGEYDFRQLTVTQKVMMEGWDVVPIILGVVVVLILFGWWAVAKLFKKHNNVSEVLVTNDNPFENEPSNGSAKIDPFDGGKI
ncbi:MAG: hypothetical protein IKC48_00325 [Clostridia bacterium]|nr:hypothetical protein [Clostridia bacterium]